MSFGGEAHWYWLIIAVVLGAAEILIPGVFLIWVAVAAAITGLATLGADLPLAAQFGLFGALAVAATWGGRRWYAANPVTSADPLLNDRAARLVGETAVLTTAIEGGNGRARVADGEWNVRGPDAPVGARVMILGIEDGALVVRPVVGEGLR